MAKKRRKDDISQLQSFSYILILCPSCANPSTNLKCHPGLSCSKKVRGQTWQVNRTQSDRVYPQTRPLLSKNTRGPRETAVLPYTAGLWWFTASVHSPYKHIIHMSSSRPLGGLFRELWSAFWRFIHFSAADETLQLQIGPFIFDTRTWLKSKILILVYFEVHWLSGVNVYLKSHKGKFSCHPFNIFMPGSCGANSQEQIKEGLPYVAFRHHCIFTLPIPLKSLIILHCHPLINSFLIHLTPAYNESHFFSVSLCLQLSLIP